jgi:potassium efflux system protein
MGKNFAAGLFLVLIGILAPLKGQTTNAPVAGSTTNAPAAAAPAGVPLANVVTAAVEDSTRLQTIQGELTTDQAAIAQLSRSLPGVAGEIERRKSEDDKLLQAGPSLSTLRTMRAAWQMLADSLTAPTQTLADRVSQLDANEAELAAMTQKWQATFASAKSSEAPADILNRINAVLDGIQQATKAIATQRTQILSAQNDVAGQNARVTTEMAAIGKARASAVNLLFVRDSEPIWNLTGSSVTKTRANPNMFGPQVASLRAYVGEKFLTALAQLVVFVALAFLLFWVRREMAPRAKDDPEVRHAAQVFEVPLATAAVLALLVSELLYPLAPQLFWAGLVAVSLIPIVIILRRLIDHCLFPIVHAMVAAYLLDQLRYLAADQPILARLLFLLEMLGAGLFLFWLIRSRRLSRDGLDLIEVRAYAHFALAAFALAVLANLLGYTHLSYLLGNGTLNSGYLAVILYAAVRIADGLIVATLRIRPFSGLGMVRGHFLQIAHNASRVFRWLAFICWGWETLEMFSLGTPLWNGAAGILTASYVVPYSKIELSLGQPLLFGLTLWGALLLSRLVRFILEEELYPNLKLGPGVPYAASTIVHYFVLVVGILFALALVGIDLSKYSVLAGALGVGLGFGLQNIMNNFVSGIILLFERPIKVGDIIQVDTAMGTVESIGIRASVIRITNGSEIIMPNGNLISNQVTNWTFSDRQRVIEMPVSVAAKNDPQRVMALLAEAARNHPLVLQNPPPQVLLNDFTSAALNFQLRAWTSNYDSWAQTRSELALAISAALARENIPLS